MANLNTLTVVMRDDANCAAYGGPPKFRTIHVALTAVQLEALSRTSYEDVEKCFLEELVTP